MRFDNDMSSFTAGHGISLMEAIQSLQKSPNQFIIVVDEAGKLAGTITDGDIRRALLNGVNLDDSIAMAMNPNPVYIMQSTGEISAPDAAVDLVPVLNDSMIPIGLEIKKKYGSGVSIPVLLMAGGRGTRLMPYTRNRPKPLVEIHGKAMIEMLIERFVSQGFTKFFVAVNHMADQIIQRLGDGSGLGATIEYIFEAKPLGTAGALGLIRDKVGTSVLVANADLVTSCDFRALHSFHVEQNASLTLATRLYEHQVPFGVVDTKHGRVEKVFEKPTWSSQVSAGIYVLAASALGLVAENQRVDMPRVVSQLLAQDSTSVAAFPIHEEWHDVGNPEELERLRSQSFGEANH